MRELLIINGQGDTMEVHPPTYKPEIPDNQVIIFPDKKTLEIDWRRNLKTLTGISELIENSEIVQEEGTYNVPLTHPNLPYAMGLIFSDAHIGSYTTDHQLITDLIDKVLQTPNSFLVDAGDTFNNGIWGGLAFEDSLPAYMQTFTVRDMARELGNKYAACVLGNHTEWMFEVTGLKPEFIFAEQIKGPVFPGMGLLHLNIGQQKYEMAIAHNYWGKSKKNIFNVCVNLRQTEYPNADIFVVGHEHIWGAAEEYVDNRKVMYIRPGTAKLRDRYARIHGIAKRGQACGLAIVFDMNRKDFNAYPIEDAIELLEARKQLAEYHS